MNEKEIKQRIKFLKNLVKEEKAKLWYNKSNKQKMEYHANEYATLGVRKEGEYYGAAYKRGVELLAALDMKVSGQQDFYIHRSVVHEITNEVIFAARKSIGYKSFSETEKQQLKEQLDEHESFIKEESQESKSDLLIKTESVLKQILFDYKNNK